MFSGIKHTVLLALWFTLIALIVACSATPGPPPASIQSSVSKSAPTHDIEATVEAKAQIEIASTSQAVPTPDPISGLISAVDLISEFEQNPVSAAYRYADQIFITIGIVTNIDHGYPYVDLGQDGASRRHVVRCLVESSSQIGDISVGSEAVIEGRFLEWNQRIGVLLEHCGGHGSSRSIQRWGYFEGIRIQSESTSSLSTPSPTPVPSLTPIPTQVPPNPTPLPTATATPTLTPTPPPTPTFLLTATPAPQVPITGVIGTQTILSEFRSNSSVATAKYINQTFSVSGKVDNLAYSFISRTRNTKDLDLIISNWGTSAGSQMLPIIDFVRCKVSDQSFNADDFDRKEIVVIGTFQEWDTTGLAHVVILSPCSLVLAPTQVPPTATPTATPLLIG